jgi:hypothetical protein
MQQGTITNPMRSTLDASVRDVVAAGRVGILRFQGLIAEGQHWMFQRSASYEAEGGRIITVFSFRTMGPGPVRRRDVYIEDK